MPSYIDRLKETEKIGTRTNNGSYLKVGGSFLMASILTGAFFTFKNKY